MKIKSNFFKAFVDAKKEEKELAKLVEFSTCDPYNDVIASIRVTSSSLYLSLGGNIINNEDLERFIIYLTALKDSEILPNNTNTQQADEEGVPGSLRAGFNF